MRKEYIKAGRCIFCGRGTEEATFYTKPHTTPHSLGSSRIGFDVCDECNHFFGSPDRSMRPYIAVETSVKEIFGLIRFLLQLNRKGHDGDMLKSVYFNFWRSRNTLSIKPSFRNPSFRRVFVRQFKRGMYELFLQEYHRATGNGLDPKFDKVRKYARYGVGDIPLWHLQPQILLVEDDLSEPRLHFTEADLLQIVTYGFYSMYLWGFWFYLEVTPRAELSREVFLSEVCRKLNVGGFVFRKIVDVRRIEDIDYTLRALYGAGLE